MRKRLTKEEFQALIDVNPLRPLVVIADEAGTSRAEIEKLLKSYQLVDYRNQKIKTIRRKERRKS